jgi:hypothetical protein
LDNYAVDNILKPQQNTIAAKQRFSSEKLLMEQLGLNVGK